MSAPRDAAAVLVIGAINVDVVVKTTRLPGPGETVVGEDVRRFGGGKGANAAVAAARAGAQVALVGAVGDDDNGRAALAELAAEGVDVSDVVVLRGVATGVALIVVDVNGENQIAVAAGANGRLDAEHIGRVVEARSGATDCVLVSTEISADAVSAAVNTAMDFGIACVVNPAPVIPVVAALASRGPILTPNAGECDELASLMSASDTTSGLQPWEVVIAHSKAPVVVTLGGKGVLVAAPGEEPEAIAARATTVVDTTGAGDTFNGVLAAQIAAGMGPKQAAATAVVAASLSVSRAGAREGMPTASQIQASQALPTTRSGR